MDKVIRRLDMSVPKGTEGRQKRRLSEEWVKKKREEDDESGSLVLPAKLKLKSPASVHTAVWESCQNLSRRGGVPRIMIVITSTVMVIA